MLTYMEVHLYYTLPLLVIVMLIHRPFASALTNFKLVFLSIMAFSTASLWDNYIVYHKAWWYCPTCVTAVIGYVPLEEYMFFLIMTVMTVHFTSLFMRWKLPILFIDPYITPYAQMAGTYIPCLAFSAVGLVSWKYAIPATSLFYGACILVYTMPVLAVLWSGAGLYIVRRAIPVCLSIIVPTVILCIIDVIAMRAGVWHINEQTSTEIFPFPDLPLEELGFFLLVDTVIVFACCAIDRTNAIIQMFPYISSTDPDIQLGMQNPFSVPYLVALLECFAYPDYRLPSQPIEDLKASLQVLAKASKSFNTASTAFSFNIRQDLGTLYSFCRITDEIADSESKPDDRQRKLNTLIEFVNDLFNTREYGQTTVTPDHIDWAKYGHLPQEDLASFRAISRMVHFLPKQPFEELIAGYQWDIDGHTVKNQDDLLNYCTFVASSVGDLCTAVIMYRTGQGNWSMEHNRSEWITHRAREMGQVLQLVNIARDIVTDSQTLGRCYVPTTYLTNPTQELELLKTGRARHIKDGNLRKYALRILALADKLSNSGSRGIDALPMEVRNGVRAACQVYSSIGIKIRTAQGYPLRAHLNTWERGWVALQCLYGLHGQNPTTRSRMDIWKIY